MAANRIWAKSRTINNLLGTLVLALLLVWAGGCATAGNSFKYDPTAGMQLGQLKKSDYRQSIGEPTRVSSETNSDGAFEQAMFVYSQANMATAKARALVLEFRNDSLNAYMFLSSYDEDKTVIDINAAHQIKQGVSTKEEVLKTLGQPHGRANVPTYHGDFKGYSKPSVTELWRWASQNKIATFGSHAINTDSVIIGFDTQGVVVELSIQEAKAKGM